MNVQLQLKKELRHYESVLISPLGQQFKAEYSEFQKPSLTASVPCLLCVWPTEGKKHTDVGMFVYMCM